MLHIGEYMTKAVPKYEALRNRIVSDIREGIYKTNDRIPSDTELMASFSVSKSTVTQALKSLEAAGYVTRKQGKGTFVLERPKRESIRMMVCPSNDMEASFWQDFCSRYNRSSEGPHLAIEFISNELVPLRDTLTKAFAGGEAPDIISIDGPDMPYWAYMNAIIPLDDFISDDLRDALFPSIIRQGTFNDRLYHLGYYESSLCLLYSKQKFSRLSLPVPSYEEGWTWDEFLGICRKAKETGGMDVPLLMDSGWGLSSRQGEWLSYFLISILAQDDAGCLDEGSHARGALDSPAAIKALDFAASLFRSGYSHINDRRELFPNDMLMSVSESRAYFALPDSVKDEIGILPLPHMKRKAAAHGGWGLCISKQSKKPAESWDVIRSFFSIENQLKLFKVVGMPARKDVYGICRDFKAINHDHETLFRQLSECSVTRPQTPAYPFISKMIGHALIEAANGADPGIVLNIAARQIDDNFYRHSYYPVFDGQEN